MYDNAGAKIKSIARTLCTIEQVICLLLGFAMGVIAAICGELLGVILLIGALFVFIIGAFFAWVKYLLLAAFGELVEDTKKTSDCMLELKNHFLPLQNRNAANINSNNVNPNKMNPNATNSTPVKMVDGMYVNEVNGEKNFYYNIEK